MLPWEQTRLHIVGPSLCLPMQAWETPAAARLPSYSTSPPLHSTMHPAAPTCTSSPHPIRIKLESNLPVKQQQHPSSAHGTHTSCLAASSPHVLFRAAVWTPLAACLFQFRSLSLLSHPPSSSVNLSTPSLPRTTRLRLANGLRWRPCLLQVAQWLGC